MGLRSFFRSCLKADLFLSGRGIDRDGDVDQAEADTSFPGDSHARDSRGTPTLGSVQKCMDPRREPEMSSGPPQASVLKSSMAADLSETPVWMPINEQILALDGKDLYFCLDGAHSEVVLRVVRGKPGTDKEGMCAVRISHNVKGEEHPTGTEPDVIVALELGQSEYLNEEAVSLISPNREERAPIELELHLKFSE